MPVFTTPRIAFLFLGLLFLSLFGINQKTFAQTQNNNKQYTENKPDLALRADVRIDPSTLGMSLEIPFGGAPGRAGTSVSSVLRYSSKQWRMNYAGTYPTGNQLHTWTRPKFSEDAVAGWTSSLDAPWIEYTGMNQRFSCVDGRPISDAPNAEDNEVCFVARIHVHLPDGSSHELRQSDTPQAFPITNPQPDFSGTFHSTDGSRIRFEGSTGVLYTADGGHYSFGAEQTIQRYNHQDMTGRWATEYVDRNGNKVTYTMTTVTDTLGRTYQNPLASNPTEGDQTYQVPGFNNQNLSYTLRWRYLADVLSASEHLSYTSTYTCVAPNNYSEVPPNSYALFPTGQQALVHICADANDVNQSAVIFNPIVLAEVVLPNGQSYRMKYSSFGEITEIIFPTGGYEHFTYEKVSQVARQNWPYDDTNRGVTHRYVSASGNGQDQAHWSYASTPSLSANKITITPPGNNGYTERVMYISVDSVAPPYGFSNPLAGMTYQEASFDANGNMLRRTLTEWSTETPSGSTRTRNPRVTRTTNLTFFPAGDALAATTAMQYDTDGNVISTGQYDYVSVSATTAQTGTISDIPAALTPTTPPLRTQETTYLVNDPDIDAGVRASYRARNLISLPSSTRVKDSGGTAIAKSSISYDEAAFPLLTYGAVTSWSDPGGSVVRGNATTTRTWLNTSNSWLESHVQFDQCGNPRRSWDARDTALANPSEIEYSSAYAYAYPTLTRSPVPDASGQQGSSAAFETTTTFDFYSGRVTSTRDANLQTTNFAYTDLQQRLTSVTRPDGSSTSYYYGDTPGNIYIRTQTSLDTNRVIESYQYFDGAARPYRTYLNEGGGNYLVTDTEFDSQGRVSRVSNPYRSTSLNGNINPSGVWTTNAYDALGRILTVTTPDSAVVNTSYVANTTTVTDQSGRQRKSVTDVLGRLVQVYEDPAGLNYLTTYEYDLLDDLTRVAQDDNPQQPTQPARTFTYDSLKRLVSTWNPESGAVSYQYDNNGNLTQKTDARGVVSTYAYDALNRNLSVVYTNSSTPAVYRYYDGFRAGTHNIANSKGKLWQSETTGANASRTTIDSFDTAGRPVSQSQQFYLASAWTQPFAVHREYNLAGGVTLQSYPSGHLVNYNYDQAGRLGDKDSQNLAFTGNLGDGLNTRTYSRGISYSPLGAMTQEQFGTDTAIYNKLAYNSRGQLAEIKASTAGNDSSWNRGKFVNWYSLQCGGAGCNAADNNGNLRKQETFIPNNEQNSSSISWSQKYEYDNLNRLNSAGEYDSANTQLWQQAYEYDRYGNRRIHQTNTWGPATGPAIPKPNFDVQISTNRLYAPGDLGLADSQRVMQYDAAGNLKKDRDASGAAVTRAYDAENRMTSETRADNSVAGSYVYNAGGQRVRRTVGGQPPVETWQVYGMDGELLAEYAANASYMTPQKEYGYRNGQLLVTADAPAPTVATNGYAYRRTITIDHSKVPNTDRSDFPLLISGTYSYLATTANGGQVQNANGYDVIFTSDSGCADKLNHEVETYNATSGAVNYWVKIPSISHTADTVLYMCYGNAGISSSQENKTGVWDSSQVGVWHLPDGAVLSLNDSTSAALNLTNHSLAATAGAVGGGASVNGSSQYGSRAANAAFNTDDYTIEAWIKRNGAGPFNQNAIIAHSPILSAGHYYVYVDDTSGKLTMDIPYVKGNLFFGATVMTTGVWYHVAVTKSGNNYVAYVNGVSDATVTDATTPTKSGDLTAASFQDTLYGGRYCNGALDELKVSGTARSADWIKTEYNNQSSPATFYAISAATAGSPAENVVWTNVTGASASGNSLTKTSATAWGNAGAASTKSIVSGDGYVEFKVTSLYTGMLGLSHTDANQDYTSMEFALLPNSDGNLYVFESGMNRGVVSTYTTADVFRVAVEGGVVKYRKNGTLVYTSTVAPTYPLLVDAGLYHNGGTQSNVVISGTLNGGATAINWLVTDQLGTPRMVFDQTGSLAGMKRHDYLPFGEELTGNQGLRTATLSYAADTVRQKFTSQERDNETGLDFFQARYYASSQGRFSSIDPLLASAKRRNPQTWNRYIYGLNNPLRYTDPDGEDAIDASAKLPERVTETTMTVTVKELGSHGRELVREARVDITDRKIETLDQAGEVINTRWDTSVSAVNTGNGIHDYSQKETDNMATAAKAIVEVSREKNFDAVKALGVAQVETHLTTLASHEKSAAKQSEINPMQLSGTSGIKPTTNLRSNIAGAIDVYNRSSGTDRQCLEAYNGQRGKAEYATNALGFIQAIRASVRTRTYIQ